LKATVVESNAVTGYDFGLSSACLTLPLLQQWWLHPSQQQQSKRMIPFPKVAEWMATTVGSPLHYILTVKKQTKAILTYLQARVRCVLLKEGGLVSCTVRNNSCIHFT
jgi:hypothetical protein